MAGFNAAIACMALMTPEVPLAASPPPQVQQDLATAQQVIADLASRQVNLHFEVDDRNTVHVQVLDSDGQVLKEIPASGLFDTLAGGGLLIDQRG